MTAGQSYSVSVTMQNTGGTTWTAAQLYRLGAVNPYDNTTWGFSRVGLGSAESVAPGQQKTFTFTVTAPTVVGTYNFQWRMVQDGVAWFGDLSANVAVRRTIARARSRLSGCRDYGERCTVAFRTNCAVQYVEACFQ
jgi:hypothetical protein